MKKRGKILRDPRTGPGLLMIEGRQYWFCLEGVWKSEAAPVPGLAVDVTLNRDGEILAITSGSEAEFAAEPDTAKAPWGILRRIAAKCGMPGPLRG